MTKRIIKECITNKLIERKKEEDHKVTVQRGQGKRGKKAAGTNKKQTIRVDLNSNRSAITLNVNGLNVPIKTHRLLEN